VEEDEGEDLIDEQNGLLGKKITSNVLNNFEGF
jgi:hypothetical protein